MSHEITSSDGLILVGERAWHGLGVVVPREAGITIREGFLRAVPWVPAVVPLTWGVSPEEAKVFEAIKLAPDSKGIVRRQAGRPDRYLATVSKDYSVVTHDDVLSIAEIVEQQGAKLETIGTTHGGRKLFLLLKVGDYGVGLNKGDVTSTYLAVLNSFDGTTAFRGFGTEVRVVCANTYAAALARADGEAVGFRIQHSGDVSTRIEIVKKAVAVGRLQLATLEAEARALEAVPLTGGKVSGSGRVAIGDYFGRVASILYPALTTEKPEDAVEAEAWERQRERARETVGCWVAELEHERQALVAGTLYAAHEAITYWADHERPRVRETAADRLFGRGAAIKLQARRVALSLAK